MCMKHSVNVWMSWCVAVCMSWNCISWRMLWGCTTTAICMFCVVCANVLMYVRCYECMWQWMSWACTNVVMTSDDVCMSWNCMPRQMSWRDIVVDVYVCWCHKDVRMSGRTAQRMYMDVTHEVRMYGRLHDVVDVCACRGIVDMHDDDVCMSYECVWRVYMWECLHVVCMHVTIVVDVCIHVGIVDVWVCREIACHDVVNASMCGATNTCWSHAWHDIHNYDLSDHPKFIHCWKYITGTPISNIFPVSIDSRQMLNRWAKDTCHDTNACVREGVKVWVYLCCHECHRWCACLFVCVMTCVCMYIMKCWRVDVWLCERVKVPVCSCMYTMSWWWVLYDVMMTSSTCVRLLMSWECRRWWCARLFVCVMMMCMYVYHDTSLVMFNRMPKHDDVYVMM